MIAGVHGRLITASFVRSELRTIPGASVAVPPHVERALRAHAEHIDAALGPVSSVRAIADAAVLPLLHTLGLQVSSRSDADGSCWLRTAAGLRPGPLVGVFSWTESLNGAWRGTILRAITADTAWCICCNGRALRIVDARRPWSRDYLEFELPALAVGGEAAELLWTLLRADAVSATPPLLDVAAQLSARHGIAVCRALGDGVLEALTLLFDALQPRRAAVFRTGASTSPATRRCNTQPAAAVLEQSLTVLYRMLFLLFAEARGLVPMWHPVYRDRYSLDTIVATIVGGRRYRGLWHAVQAISRMAHAGCSAGELKVTAFNGRLFAPAQSTAFNAGPLDDDLLGRALLAVSTTRSARAVRDRIAYRDLDVEQLGAVYERVLDYEPVKGGRESFNEDRRGAPAALARTGDIRKASGTFYTPRAVTAFLVRRTLEPLVRDRMADDILKLRVLDPAMGSGAFLVAACRYLASTIEDALVREGRWHTGDVSPDDRIALRREIASRCLYGVDLNPTAVQLARLSLWLATLARDQPLSFLDHHLVAGNSLVGATPDDLRRQPSGGRKRSRHNTALPLFDDELVERLTHDARVRMDMASESDRSVDIVRAKERMLATLREGDTAVTRWSRALDLWCAGWFWRERDRPNRGTFEALIDRALDRPSAVPPRAAAALLAHGDSLAEQHRFLHWPLAFPEAFTTDGAGFDAIVGNPPWDMVRGDSGSDDVRDERKRDARQLIDFVRGSGVYRADSRGHVNRYQLFLERAMQLAKRGGRIGFVLPSGAVTDAGSAELRRHLFDRADVDSITGLDNRGGIFPIHRSVRFVLLTATSGRPTSTIACRFGVHRVEQLEAAAVEPPLMLSRPLLARLSGADDLGIPELTDARDLRIVERISATIPALGGEPGWHVQFGRELNASDDRAAFAPYAADSTARPVVEGKQIEPFRVSVEKSRLQLRPGADQGRRVPRRARLAYRDIASATNRMTLIAAIIPARAVTTHTLFCLRTPLPVAEQQVLCALLNSFVANYLVRLRVNTHVTVALVSRLPVPVVKQSHPEFDRLAALAARLMSAAGPVEEMPEYAELQGIVARVYGVSEEDFTRVLETFPLVPKAVRDAAVAAFNNLH